MDVQDNATPAGLRDLRDSVAELTFAFAHVAGLLCGVMEGAGVVDRDKLADRLEFEAREAGRKFAETFGGAEEPNSLVLNLANAVRSLGSGLRLVED